jgi:hypothetical protein
LCRKWGKSFCHFRNPVFFFVAHFLFKISFPFLSGVRFLQILRMLHVDRQGGTWLGRR